MLKNKSMLIFITILIAVIIIAISVVVSQYNKNKPIVPDRYIEVSSSQDMLKIKSAYESEGKKEEFLSICEAIELATANKLLDGSVTNNEQLSKAIVNINNILASEDWSSLGIETEDYWMGKWSLDTKGDVKFEFQNNNLKPSWVQDEEIKKYIK